MGKLYYVQASNMHTQNLANFKVESFVEVVALKRADWYKGKFRGKQLTAESVESVLAS